MLAGHPDSELVDVMPLTAPETMDVLERGGLVTRARGPASCASPETGWYTITPAGRRRQREKFGEEQA